MAFTHPFFDLTSASRWRRHPPTSSSRASTWWTLPTTRVTSTTNLAIPMDLSDPRVLDALPTDTDTHTNVYGVPWIIGARKGFPNLNEVDMQSVSSITRKLQVTKPAGATSLSQYQTRQAFVVGISNVIGVEVWNSYQTNYPRPVYIQVDGSLSMALTNDYGINYSVNKIRLGGAKFTPPHAGAIALPQWPGTGVVPGFNTQPSPQSFQVPLLTNVVFLPQSVYRQNPPGLFPVAGSGAFNWNMNQPGNILSRDGDCTSPITFDA